VSEDLPVYLRVLRIKSAREFYKQDWERGGYDNKVNKFRRATALAYFDLLVERLQFDMSFKEMALKYDLEVSHLRSKLKQAASRVDIYRKLEDKK
jgi:hypothetical protein